MSSSFLNNYLLTNSQFVHNFVTKLNRSNGGKRLQSGKAKRAVSAAHFLYCSSVVSAVSVAASL